MSADAVGGAASPAGGAADTKTCCARLYESEIVVRLLGESFHPGGARLTGRLGEILGLTAGSHVLDVACGRGTSAILLTRQFGCSVVGIDFSERNVAAAISEAERLDLQDRLHFEVGDGERLPAADASVDAVICECAFCLFPDKDAAAREFFRVLKPGGRVGLSDVTRAAGPPGELEDLMSWIACLADARSTDAYAGILRTAGFVDPMSEGHDEALTDMIRDIQGRLLAAEILAGLNKIDLTGIDVGAAKRMSRQAASAVAERRLGYAIVWAGKL